MSSGQYYYFVAGLPRIGIDDAKLQIEPEAFLEQAATQLTDDDLKLLKLLTLEDGIKTLSALLFKQEAPADRPGFYEAAFWSEFGEFARLRVENREAPVPKQFKDLPPFLLKRCVEFLSLEEPPARIMVEHGFYQDLFSFAAAHSNRFVSAWFEYRRQSRNVVLAINGRAHELDYARWLIGEDELNDKLAHGRGVDFGIGKSSPVFDAHLRAYEQNSVLYRERAYDILSWKWIDSHNFFQYFSIDRVLGYFAQLLILSRWMRMDVNLGKEVFYDTLNTLQNSFSFPPEFAIKQKNK